MAKKPTQATIADKVLGLIKRNPISAIAGLITILVGIPGAIASYNVVIEPAIPSLRYWVRDHVAEVVRPIVVTQNSQAVAIDRFLLYQQQDAIAKAKADPFVVQSHTAQERVKALEYDAKETQARICKANPSAMGC